MTPPLRSPRSPEPPSAASPGEASADDVVFQGIEAERIGEPASATTAPALLPRRPGWFQPRPPGKPPLIVPPDVDVDDRRTRLPRSIGLNGLQGFLISLVLHAIILAGLSVWVIHRHADEFGFSIDSAFVTDDVDMIADVQLDGALDDPGEEAAPLTFVPVLDQLNNAADFTPSDSITGALDGDGQETDKGAGGRLPEIAGIKVPAYAITKGSFSVWTEPKDPLPGRPYNIVIQIRVPTTLAEKAKVFSISRDITADVRGTDGFTKRTTFKGTPPLPIEDGFARTFIVIPGAQQLVRDHIKVTSRMLKETQEFDIEF